MSTIIQCTGSGESETQIDYLYDKLEQYTLDPIFEPFVTRLNDVDDHSWITGSRPIEFQEFTHMFIGNFPKIEIAFSVYTSDRIIISTLIVLISLNVNSQNYKNTKFKT